VIGLPVEGSIDAAEVQDSWPQGVFTVGRLAQSDRVCASWLLAAVASAAPL
jgi:hypothetical protein